MRRWLAGGVLGLGLLTCLGGGAAARGRLDPGKFGWLDDYGKARAEARRSGRPMLLVFR